LLIDLTQQQQAAFAAEVSAAEIGLDPAPAKAPKFDLIARPNAPNRHGIGQKNEVKDPRDHFQRR
jgi:hypothetical protein